MNFSSKDIGLNYNNFYTDPINWQVLFLRCVVAATWEGPTC